MRVAYDSVHMVLNESKTCRRSLNKTLWGAHIDGIKGRVSAPTERAMALAVLTCHVASMGLATVKLLE
eukprot:13787451-Heterocapsa_arctica.AAC.1